MKPPIFIQTNPLSTRRGVVFAVVAVASFHLAYWVPGCQWFMGLFLYCLFRLANLGSARLASYFGLGIGLAVYAPNLIFFWTVFGPGAIALWFVLAFWLGLFLLGGRAVIIRFGPIVWALAAPFFWTGMEYFRSELYYLRFSWLNAGYAFSTSSALPYMAGFGVYGIGFLLMAWAAYVGVVAKLSKVTRYVVGVALAAVSTLPLWLPVPEIPDIQPTIVTGVQLEFSPPGQVQAALDAARKKYPQTDLFVLSEYTFDGPVPQEILDWCKEHHRWLAAGGKDPISSTRYYNSVFVVGPDGNIAFRQAKCVPVQFMKDGSPAPEQRLWDSPWGQIGFGICYDASYTRVTDELIRQGAQFLIFPTMDIAEWGKEEHKLHGRIAPMRAAEYLIPVFRLCSSGISQFVGRDGRVISSAPFPGQDVVLSSKLEIATPGRMPLDRPVAPLAVVLTGMLLLYMIVEAWWAPRPPPPP
jgi:apolipoprotein N-acyltransferase